MSVTPDTRDLVRLEQARDKRSRKWSGIVARQALEIRAPNFQRAEALALFAAVGFVFQLPKLISDAFNGHLGVRSTELYALGKYSVVMESA
jgi:hypothetical protein